eukprot:m.453985 g.453985  ORF g.453985 m.453985 type:complete len:749 (+) comp21560_c0_seq1:111-2357(+)
MPRLNGVCGAIAIIASIFVARTGGQQITRSRVRGGSNGQTIVEGRGDVILQSEGDVRFVSHASGSGMISRTLGNITADINNTATMIQSLETTVNTTRDELWDGLRSLNESLKGYAQMLVDQYGQEFRRNNSLCPPGYHRNNGERPGGPDCIKAVLVIDNETQTCNAMSEGMLVFNTTVGRLMKCDGTGVFRAVTVNDPGSDQLDPAPSCQFILEASRQAPTERMSGWYWLLYAGAPSAVRGYCDMSVEPAIDMGGSGDNALSAGASCFSIATVSSAVGRQQVYINPGLSRSPPVYMSSLSRTTCDLTHARIYNPGTSTLTIDTPGPVNSYAYMISSFSSGASTIRVRSRVGSTYVNDASVAFSVGDLIMIHQTQMFSAETRVGVYEYNRITAVSGTSITLLTPLVNNFVSDRPNIKRQSRVAQVVRVAVASTITVATGTTVMPLNWDGYTGGIMAMFADGIVVAGTAHANCLGFRGGDSNPNRGCSCQSHVSAGHQGESWTGRGDRDNITARFSCCGGPTLRPAGYGGRALNNAGGGGGGSGACHGGGGAGGAYDAFDASMRCPSNCGNSNGRPGDGAPECGRAGSWASRGVVYGAAANMSRVALGSGGGGGNGYSPLCSGAIEENAGGNGGGIVVLKALSSINVTGMVQSNGCQGLPRAGTTQGNWWVRSNSQDGSGGAGSGGAIYLESDAAMNIGTNRLVTNGGSCGVRTGWGGNHQMGGHGGNGRIHTRARTIVGAAARSTRSSP